MKENGEKKNANKEKRESEDLKRKKIEKNYSKKSLVWLGFMAIQPLLVI